MITQKQLEKIKPARLNLVGIPMAILTKVKDPAGYEWGVIKVKRTWFKRRIKSFYLETPIESRTVLVDGMMDYTISVVTLKRDELERAFEYYNGTLFRRLKGKVKAITTKNSDGYTVVNYRQKIFRASHIIWTMNVGKIPSGHIITHKNGNRGDDRIINLLCVKR